MGITAGLCVVPAEEFVPREDGSITPKLPKDCAWFDLDKAWWEFGEVLRDMPEPLNLAIEGDLCLEDSRSEDNRQDDATRLSFVTPGTVAEIARGLEPIDANEIMEFLEQARLSTPGDEWERKTYSDYFEHLKEAYRTAAREGAGLGILLC
jgi:hypothetical protein